MKTRHVKRRLTLHFTYQMLLTFVLVLLMILTLVLVFIRLLVNEDMKQRFPFGSLDVIIMETDVTEHKAVVPNRWVKQLAEQHYWLQVVNSKGDVIYGANTPADVPQAYTTGELLVIQQTKRYGPYEVMMSLDDSVPNMALFMLGYVNDRSIEVQSIYAQYARDGALLSEDAMEQLNEELTKSRHTLQIIDGNGQVLQTAGMPMERERYAPLEIISMEQMKADFPTIVSVHADRESNTFWVLHEIKRGGYVNQPFMKEAIAAFSIIGGAILIATLAFSIYHGYRYGRPLLLFIDWFARLGRGQYEETLSAKDQKRIYRKNGKLRRKYKLYKEVIDGFREMTLRLHAADQDRIRLEKTREEWMTGISHDLRTPLSSIQGYGHLLESGQYSFTEEELKEMGGIIRDKSDYMIDLIQDFSLAFQLKNKQVPFEVTPLELEEFVRRIVLNYVNDMTMEGTTFQYDHDDESTPIRVLANAKWFARMLDNVIMNAVKHNPEGTTIAVSVAATDGYAVLSVNDDGIGMDKDTLRNLFERYYRGTNTEEKNGAGLGMSIARSIVLAHNGTIEVESEIGKGTRITVTLPLLPESASF